MDAFLEILQDKGWFEIYEEKEKNSKVFVRDKKSVQRIIEKRANLKGAIIRYIYFSLLLLGVYSFLSTDYRFSPYSIGQALVSVIDRMSLRGHKAVELVKTSEWSNGKTNAEEMRSKALERDFDVKGWRVGKKKWFDEPYQVHYVLERSSETFWSVRWEVLLREKLVK